MKDKKWKIGFYTNSGLEKPGGGEVYLKSILEHIDYNKYEIKFFCADSILASFYKDSDNFSKIAFAYFRNPFNSKLDKNQKYSKSKTSRKKHFKNSILKIWNKLPQGNLKSAINEIWKIKKLKNYFSTFDVDLLHINGMDTKAVIAAKLAGIQVIISTCHLLPFSHKQDGIVQKLLRYLANRSLIKTIYDADAVRDIWVKEKKMDKSKNKVIYNGVDIFKFKYSANTNKSSFSNLNIGHQKIIIGITARLYPIKGHIYLLKAIPKIVKRVKNIKFLFVGDGPLKTELIKEAKRMGISNYVLFLGHIENMTQVINLYDIAVLPSIGESLPISNLEAMACGKPVVATDVGGVSEVVVDGETGIIVSPGNSEELANAIIELAINEEKRVAMGKAGRKRVEKYFTEEVMLNKTFSVYDELLESSETLKGQKCV